MHGAGIPASILAWRCWHFISSTYQSSKVLDQECKRLRPVQSREEAYLRTMSVGLNPWRAGLLRAHLQLGRVYFWGMSCLLGCFELMHLRVL